MTKPPGIAPGDTIAVVSPASPVAREKLANGIRTFEERGYRLTFGKHAFDSKGYLAGSDEDRAGDIMDAWFDPEVKAVFCSRGGYGCARLLPLLDLDRMAKEPKLFAGFSDITTLHLALNRRGLATLHAPMLLSFVKERAPWVVEMLFTVLEGTAPIQLPKAAQRPETIVGGIAEGVVTGGCLCLLCDSLDTPDTIDAGGKILLIEDVDEPPYRIDAMLTHLYNAGKLENVAGIVVGEMTRTDEKAEDDMGCVPWQDIVIERLRPLGVPMVIGFPFGHAEGMASLPLGIKARLDADAGELSYLEIGVAK
jgi:muramoyltetrapeptide carboxypeptidase